MEQGELLDLQETLKATVLATGSAAHDGDGQPVKKDQHFHNLPRDVLERLATHFTLLQDLIAFASTCSAAHSLVFSREWPNVTSIQLLHSVPMASTLKRWVERCSNICEVDAENCSELSSHLLLTLADLALKVVRLNGCWQLKGVEAQSAITKLAAAGCLEVFDVRNTSIDINTDVMELLSISPNLRELCAPMLHGEWHGDQEGEHTTKNLFWPSLHHLHFTSAYLEHNNIFPWKLRSLVLENCSISSAISTLFFPALTEVTIKRAIINLHALNNLGQWCPNLVKLDLSGSLLGDEELSAITEGRALSCARLKHLIFRDLYHPSSYGFKKLLTSLAKPLSVKKRAGEEQVPGLVLDFSGCANIADDSFEGYSKNFEKWQSKGLPVRGIQELRLAKCWQISHALGHRLASIGSLDQLQVLDLSKFGGYDSAYGKDPAEVAQISGAFCNAVSAAGRNLKELNLDAAAVNEEVFAAIARCCSRLESLSLITCYRSTAAGWQALSEGYTLLKSLAVGGSLNWREWLALAAFKGLKELTIWHPDSGFDDSFLVKVLRQHSQLEKFKLSMSKGVTDRALMTLPADTLRELTLDHCNSIHGHSIARLTRLERLRLLDCNCITEVAVLAIALSCGRLRLLELLHHVQSEKLTSCAHEIGLDLRVEGGA